jgi:serine/threonine protein kinase
VGKGATSQVKKAMYRGQMVAVKVMFTGLEIDNEVLKVFKMEVKVLTRCCHPNIISIYGAYSTSSSLGIVEELAQCSLHDLIHPTDESTALMPLHQVRVFFRKF